MIDAAALTRLPSHVGCVYLHGFLSSSHSQKAQQLIRYFSDHQMSAQLRVPNLAFEPSVAILQARACIHELQQQEGIERVFLDRQFLGRFLCHLLVQHREYRCDISESCGTSL